MVNTAQATNIRNAFSDVFDEWGSTVSLRTSGTITYDDWGEPTHSGTSDTSTIGVLDNNVIARMNLTSAGRLKEEESILLLKGTETVDETYTVVIGSDEYNIVEVEEIKAANVTIVYRLIIASK